MPPEQPIEIPRYAFDALRELRVALEPAIPSALGYQFGIGIKETGGEFTDTLALVAFVPEKKAREDVPDHQLVPPDFRGFSTDVVELKPTLIAADQMREDPLRGGIQISKRGDVSGSLGVAPGFGTLGAIVRDRLSGERLLLTCGHVVLPRPGHPDPGPDVFQPQHVAVSTATVIGQRRHAAFTGLSGQMRDWATVTPTGPQGIVFTVKEIGPMRGVAAARLWEPVRKRGACTGLTTGVVVRVIPDLAGLTVHQMEIATFPFSGVFADHGDSGSVVLNNRDEAVGLLWSLNLDLPANRPETCESAVQTTGLALAITDALNDLQVDMAVTPTITSVSPNTLFGVASTFGRVTVDGFGFDSGSAVKFGDEPALWTSFVSPTRLETTPPIGPTGTVSVRVSNRWGDESTPGPESDFSY